MSARSTWGYSLSWIASRARRWTQLALGVLWLLDGLLQLQPYMLGTGLARNIIEPAAEGQPALVADSVKWSAHLILMSPLGFDLAFALAQLCIGAAILCRRTLRLGLAASVVWAAAVWWFGEAAGQVTSGTATLISGAPGAVLLYAMVALLAWPGARTSRWVRVAWTALWGTGALLQLLPPQRGAGSVASAITSNAGMAPHWLASADLVLGSAASGAGAWAPAIVTALFLIVAAAPYLVRAARNADLALGAFIACVIWLVGEGLGGLYTGQATDPNTGPLLILLAFATTIATSEPRAWDTEQPIADSADPEFLAATPEPSHPGPARAWRGPTTWVLAVTAAACAVTIAALGHSPQPLRQASGTMTPMKPPSSQEISPAMSTMTQAFVVRVLGTTSARIDLDIDINGQRFYMRRSVALPYSVTVPGQAESVAVIAQVQSESASSTVSCAIGMNGMPMVTDRSSGADPLVSCELDP